MKLNSAFVPFVFYHLIGTTSAFTPPSKSSSITPFEKSISTNCDVLSSSSSLAAQECKDDERKINNESSLSSIMGRRSMISTTSSIAAATAFGTTFGLPSVSQAAATTTSVPNIPEWTLQNNVKMPILALNTVGLSVDETNRAVGLSLKNGITHVDFHPGKERDGVAKYIASNLQRRKDLFLNTKIRKAAPGTSPKDAAELVRKQIDEDLSILNVPYVDMLMLRDSPDPKVMQSQWAVLEDAMMKKGQTRSIGVINYCQFSLKSIMETAKVKPAVNYYLNHVGMGLDPRGLRSFGENMGIRTFAYGAVGEPGPNSELLNLPVVKKIANVHKVTPEAVALRWILQTGAAVSVRPTLDFGLGTGTCSSDTTKCEDGLRSRANSFNWSLTKDEMNELNALTSPNDNPTLFSSTGCPDSFSMLSMLKKS